MSGLAPKIRFTSFIAVTRYLKLAELSQAELTICHRGLLEF
jgi:hypothetical protein